MDAKVEIVIGDIADVEAHQTDVYVVAANNELWMGAGAAGALKRSAGEQVEQEATAQAPIDVAVAVVTSSGNMPPPTKGLIHAAAMGFTDRTQIYATHETVSQATRNSLKLCEQHGWTSIAFPALGTGVGGLDFETAAAAMIRATRDYLGANSSIQRVRFVVTTEERKNIFEHMLREITPC